MDFEKLSQNLRKRGFSVSHFPTAAEAARHIDAATDGKTIGIGGSMTVTDMGLYELLSGHNQIFWHHKDMRDEVMLEACNAEVYITSANGVSENGDIINIDGRGNRVAGTLMKKEKVYIIIGANKVAPDFETALERARNIAAPKNSQRLSKKTPCAVNADKCYDCNSPDRICRAMSVHWGPTKGFKRVEVVIINESLGL